ncbi:Replication factor C subunit 1 [Zancudomyces culisetae]|uniref:Replication factor C subunit 1 n=1 Tax=Zancudomyces culisetae TaxID=1213189 RepID=A0A1R1PV84_ZANCU|nr:Replication factor C subunit 1 [Zancudomyces culisetae]|eukprot:OMH84792.1 Replication factor C subunit 1 [Zancudomyces culisetae]
MPSHSVLSCVRPAYFATGSRNAMYNFPAWLGKNSSRNKNLRLASELEGHLRSSVTADKLQVRQEYLGGLFLAVVWPLVQAGKHGDVKETIEHVIDIMDGYNLTRQDFDTITELLMVKSVVNIFYSAGNDKHDKEIKRRIDMVKALLSQYTKTGIETKVKNAFTRTFNTKSHRFTAEGGSAGSGGGEGGRAKKGGGMMMAKPDLEDVIDEEEEDDSTNGNGEDEPGTDTLISVKNKRKGSSTSTKSAAKPAAKPRKRAPAKK